jgi:hypothetical protein
VSGPIKIAIIGDGKQAKKEAKDVGQTYESVFSKLGDSVRVGVSKSFGGLRASASSGVGDLLGSLKSLPALGVGVALGGSLVAGFKSALDLEDARGVLQAQLGLTGPESEKAGKVAGDLYKQAYGESISDVNDVLKDLFQTGLAGIGDSENKIQGVAQSAFTLSKVMGEETLPITRAVAQMLKTGLASNAKEAFDILTRGQQLGLNKSEDLLDTFNEYGTQFRKLGLSGADALGLINQLLQGGARDSDLAADAIKEFAIRAVDGSTLTASGFKAIGLNAHTMAEEIGKGGSSARTAFGQVLTAINSIKDPVKRNTAGVALFGTQWEDLGGAIGKANLSTAAAGLGQVAGATARANAATTTTSTKLTQIARTIQFTLTDAIAKYALPKLNQFVSWFQGPGKFAIVEWAIGAGQGVLGFIDKMLGALQVAIPTMAKFAAVGLLAAASLVAVANPGQALAFVKQAKAMDDWGTSAQEGIGKARTELQGWSTALGAAKTKVEFTANIDDLDQKITAAREQLKDPKLTATRRAKLEANITQLEHAKTEAVKQLGDQALIKTRTAQLTATKTQLTAAIDKAKTELSSKDLTKERRATLNASYAKLVAARKAAQADLDKLHGVTVPVTITVTAKINAAQVRNKVAAQLERYGLEPRANGGPVLRGRTYLVGENGPELVTMGASGFVTPTQKLSASVLDAPAGSGAGGAPVVINVYALTGGPEVGRQVVKAIGDYEEVNGSRWRKAS